MNQLQPVLDLVDRAKEFGFREVPNGARLYGHVPHIAPEAWLHQLFSPLSAEKISALEATLKLPLPTEFREFLHVSNGIKLFSAAVAVYGRRTSFVRTGDEVWQPFCIVTANTFDKPAHARPEHLVVGSYQDDGSLIFLDTRSGDVFRTKGRSKKILNRWNGFYEMLNQEAQRLADLFDSRGRRIAEGSVVPSPDV